jgi:hypothetical protein
MAAVEKESKIIVFGGRKKENAEGDLNDLWEFDTQVGCWQMSLPGETPRKALKLTWQHVGMMQKVINRMSAASARKHRPGSRASSAAGSRSGTPE